MSAASVRHFARWPNVSLSADMLATTPDNLARWLVNPRGVTPKTVMPCHWHLRTAARDVAACSQCPALIASATTRHARNRRRSPHVQDR
jgi:hypothetical protein